MVVVLGFGMPAMAAGPGRGGARTIHSGVRASPHSPRVEHRTVRTGTNLWNATTSPNPPRLGRNFSLYTQRLNAWQWYHQQNK